VAIQKTQGILLYKRDIRETSSLAVFYTEDFGKIKGLIKGVRGPQAVFGQYLREFGRYDLIYYEKRKVDTDMITQCDLKDAYLEIAEDLNKRLAAFNILELVDKFTPLQENSADIYKLLRWILDLIRKETFIEKVVAIFQLKLLEYTGFLPQLDSCTNCSGPLPKDAYFSIRLSGLLCGACRRTDVQAIPFSKGATASINMIRRQSIKQFGRLELTKGIARELKLLLDRFIVYHLGELMRTQEFIKEAESQGVI